jgi:L-lactate dehydrogenase
VNLAWLEAGVTRTTGEPTVLKDRRGAFSWDAGFLPGPWVVGRAVAEAAERALDTGVAAVTLRRCSHVACLAAYLIPLLDRQLVGLMTASTPDERFVSPFGAHQAVFSNNPLAFCAPTSGAPLLFDISMAITAGGQVSRAARQGRRLPEASLKTATGAATDDPTVMSADPPGTVMPIGGLGHGHKGYALTLLTEVLTQGLGGHGRRDAGSEGEANSVFIEVMDPRAFADWSEYLAEVDYLVRACRAAAPDDPAHPVRVPGEAAWARRRQALVDGVTLYPGVLEAMLPWAGKLGVTPPQPLS